MNYSLGDMILLIYLISTMQTLILLSIYDRLRPRRRKKKTETIYIDNPVNNEILVDEKVIEDLDDGK